MEITVLTEAGKERTYRLRGSQLTESEVRRLVDRIEQVGAIQSPSYAPAKLLHHDVAEAA